MDALDLSREQDRGKVQELSAIASVKRTAARRFLFAGEPANPSPERRESPRTREKLNGRASWPNGGVEEAIGPMDVASELIRGIQGKRANSAKPILGQLYAS